MNVQRCDAKDDNHDLQRGERYLEIVLTDANKAPHTLKMYCVRHAQGLGAHYVMGLFNGTWTAIRAEWREAL